MKFKIFGCKVNKYYTDEWLNSEYLKDKKGIFVASCVVTDKAKRKWLKFIKDTAKQIPPSNSLLSREEKLQPKIYISWCWAFKSWEAQDDFFDIYPEIADLKWQIEILWEKPEELKKEIVNSKEVSPSNSSLLKGRKSAIKAKIKKIPQIYTKKFLLVQWWCDSFCTFCLTVIKRWKHYFRDKDDIVDEILEFEKNWWKEVVLTWVNLSAWWLESTNPLPCKEGEYEIPSRFAELLEHILENTTIQRVRISSMGPEFIDSRCLEVFKQTRIYPHFHYSVQSWSTNILKSMHRHYDWEYMRELLEKTKNIVRDDLVEVSIWADLIVWFPGETKQDFMDTYNLVKDWLITKVHAFPFSAHTMWESVPAWSFKNQLSDKEKKERMWELEEISDKIRDEFIERNIGKEFKVLIEVVKSIPSPLHSELLPLTSKEVINEQPIIKWKWWTQNYIDVDQSNFEINSWKIKRNEIVNWKLIK